MHRPYRAAWPCSSWLRSRKSATSLPSLPELYQLPITAIGLTHAIIGSYGWSFGLKVAPDLFRCTSRAHRRRKSHEINSAWTCMDPKLGFMATDIGNERVVLRINLRNPGSATLWACYPLASRCS